MKKPNLFFWLRFNFAQIFLFAAKWAIGAVVFTYIGKWLGFSLTTQRTIATVWLLWVSFKAVAIYPERKRIALYRYEESQEEGQEEMN